MLTGGDTTMAQADPHFASGDNELLETTTARIEVLPREGKSYGEITAKLYAGVFGGM